MKITFEAKCARVKYSRFDIIIHLRISLQIISVTVKLPVVNVIKPHGINF